MPSVAPDGPSVSMSFANNFWGRDDAGVHPLLGRMQDAKVTTDEIKSFYNARAAIEDEYARKLLSLARKPLGSAEVGTLRASLDTVRGEVDSMGKSHSTIASQMKSELEEPLAAFAGGLKERRKIVQTGVEKLHKVKSGQTQTVNKSRDRYEQHCLQIKGYLAQGHMVMGQEERKNKAKLEKTQIQLSATSNEYEAAVKALEETTGRWNREWKAACDKFQDFEEERLDFLKSSLWSFANIASTVCVSDDASCEKIRLSLEKCEVEKDIGGFIRERGTGQEIPDPPKYINFCRGDVPDGQSDTSEDDYSVAQFQRTINPAFRSSSPAPSSYESHHDPNSHLAHKMGPQGSQTPPSRETTVTPAKTAPRDHRPPQSDPRVPQSQRQGNGRSLPSHSTDQLAAVPHNEYPMDGMTMYCRTDTTSDRSSAASATRPSSRDSQSEYSNPTSFSSQEPPSGKQSPVKSSTGPQLPTLGEERQPQKKKSGFFQGHSPFRRKSKHEKENRVATMPHDQQDGAVQPPANRNTWSASTPRSGKGLFNSPNKGGAYGHRGGTPEPVDPNANFQLNVGNNVFDVESPDKKPGQRGGAPQKGGLEGMDPIAQALADLKGVNKQSSIRMSADRYHGIQTPAPNNPAVAAAQRGTPPPSYDPPTKRLDAPQPAFTSAQMQKTRQKYVDQTQNMLRGPASGSESGRASHQAEGYGSSRSATRGHDVPRAASPAPPRSASPRPGGDSFRQNRSVSPSPYHEQSRSGRMQTPQKNNGDGSYYSSRQNSPQDGQIQLSPGPGGHGGSYGSRGRNANPSHNNARPASYYGGGGTKSYDEYDFQPPSQPRGGGQPRSKSVADSRQFTPDGRPVLHFARAMYMYQAAIPEELSFAKGDVLAVLRLQDDGWWEAEVTGKRGRAGLVPSNYLQNC